MSSFSPDTEVGEFVISSCFYKGFYFSIYWDYCSVRFLLAGIDDQTSRVYEFVLAFNDSVSTKKINNCKNIVLKINDINIYFLIVHSTQNFINLNKLNILIL